MCGLALRCTARLISLGYERELFLVGLDMITLFVMLSSQFLEQNFL
jgi:hypothetical protein